MTDAAQKLMTVPAFLDWDDGTDRRYELVRGEVRAMAPATDAHGTIVVNAAARLSAALRPPCRVVSKAGIVLPDRADTYFVADLAVTCSPPERGRVHLADPLLVVEVLSPSTAAHDRGAKLYDYRRIASVAEIVLVSTEERRVELWRRDGERWIVQDLIGEAVARLESVGADLALADLYRNVAV